MPTLWYFVAWDQLFLKLYDAAVPMSRFTVVPLLCAITNHFRLQRISLREQLIIAYGGLRGGVGFSLVLVLDRHAINVNKSLASAGTLFTPALMTTKHVHEATSDYYPEVDYFNINTQSNRNII